MSVIAIVNRKGGSGKSTLATHVAAWLSRRGERVMLGDVDRQQSVVHWLRRREKHTLPGAPLVGWALDPRNVLRPPTGVGHVVLDTPGGLQGFDLSRLLMYVDIVLMPVCHSIFDRESAADCLAEMHAHPRVARGRVQVAVVGMRVDSRTRGEQHMRAWAEAHGVEFLGALREAQSYVRCAEAGLTVFDLPRSKAQFDLAQWQALVDRLAAMLETVVGTTSSRSARLAIEAPAVRPLPVQGSGRTGAATQDPGAAPRRLIGLSSPSSPTSRISPISPGGPVNPGSPISATGAMPLTSSGPKATGLRRLLGWLLPNPLLTRARHGS